MSQQQYQQEGDSAHLCAKLQDFFGFIAVLPDELQARSTKTRPVWNTFVTMSFGTAALFSFFWSTIKYLIGVGVAMAGFHNPFYGWLFTSTGAMFGVVLFTYSEFWLEGRMRQWFKPKKRFSKTKRRLVWLRLHGGLPLIALLTPLILSIPVGTLLCTTFIHEKHKILIWQGISILFWGGLIFGSLAIFDVNLVQYLKR
jgi:hypothetical protein